MKSARRTPNAVQPRAAERAKRAEVSRPVGAPPDAAQLIHDLEVHQIELEMQNEELRTSRADLELALQRYTDLFDFAPIAYVAVTCDGIIRAVNLAGARLLHRERRHLVACALATFVPADQHPPLVDLIGRALNRRAGEHISESCEILLTPVAVESVAVRITASAIDAPTATVLLAIEDISAQKAAEAALRQDMTNKDTFLAVLSHELRNPLAPMRTGLFMLSRPDADDAQRSKALEVVDRQAAHLSRLVEDLLDITRIERGLVQLRRTAIDLVEVLRRTMDDHRAAFDAQGLRFIPHLGTQPCWVNADGARLVQVFGNLLGNAAKFSSRGGSIDVVWRRDDGQAIVAIRDTGIGIAVDMLPHIFGAFVQVPQSSARTSGGLGIGLSMVKGIIELHDGTVTAASPGLGHGSEITVTLPMVSAPAPAPAPAPSLSPHGPSPRLRVLVIEDNIDAADSLRDVLALLGHDVQVAYDGPTALALARERAPDVVFCDIGLPDMDGHDVAQAMRREPTLRDTYMAALSGYTQANDLRRAIASGFDRHLAKPPNIDTLEQLLALAALRRSA